MRTVKVILGAAMLSGSVFAGAQMMVPMQPAPYQDYDDRRAFKDGYKQGVFDARNGRRADLNCDRFHYRDADDVRYYREGYIRGFREVRGEWRDEWVRGDRDRDGDRDGNRDRNWVADYARRMGKQDGLNDGMSDRRTGHSYRPTHDNSYKHADNGYEFRFGNKNDYKAFYREGYARGYEEGWNNPTYYRR
jgi:hypothetical protein